APTAARGRIEKAVTESQPQHRHPSSAGADSLVNALSNKTSFLYIEHNGVPITYGREHTLYRPSFNPPSIVASRLRILLPARLAGPVCTVNGLVGDDSFTSAEPESNNSEEGASIALNLPRRRLLVQFTCNSCGERTERLVNRLAYERGSVFVQQNNDAKRSVSDIN
ncbi:hypothetical protein PIB30_061835, partial [Stylosanthes scabra]|nr:hypothetical protein [Stylosanthes scabra]